MTKTTPNPELDLNLLARQWGARRIPFTDKDWLSADPLDQALRQLDHSAALRSVLLIIGPNGAGKSALVSHWADQLDRRRFEPLILTQATLSGSSILAALTAKLGKNARCRRETNLALIEEALAELEHTIPVIILDEAQQYSCGALEEIRLLLGLNLCSPPAFALVLIGDDYFLGTLKLRHHRALYSRIAFRVALSTWSSVQSETFVRRSLSSAGIEREVLEPAAMELLVSSAGGIARSLVLLARNAWIAAASGQQTTLTTEHVQTAIRQMPCVPGLQRPSQPSDSL